MPFAFGILGFLLLSGLLLFAVSPGVRASVAIAPAIALPLGLWIIAPRFLRAHTFHPLSVSEWVTVDLFLCAAFVILGWLLALVSAWPTSAVASSRAAKGVLRRRMAVATAALLPAAYVLLSFLVERGFFLYLPGIKPELLWVAAVAVVAGLLSAFATASLTHTRSALRSVFAASAILSFAALAMLYARTQPGRATAPSPLPPLIANHAVKRPTLVVGLDGANWRVLRPLLESHRVPTFERLIAHGVSGVMHAPWPPYWSGPAWAALVSGHASEDLGVHSDMTATAPGLSMFDIPLTVDLGLTPVMLVELIPTRLGWIDTSPTPRSQLRVAPIWERLSTAGVKNAVVNFRFTYPAVGQSAYVISDRVTVDLWDMMGTRSGARDLIISPASLAEAVLPEFQHEVPEETTVELVLGRESRPKPADALVDPTTTIKRVLGSSGRMFQVTEDFVRRDPSLSAVFFFSPDFDEVSHALWSYRFPEDFPEHPPAPADVAVFGPVLDRYLIHLDSELGELIKSFPTTPNVVIVSDHGEGPADLITIWRGWHSSEAIFIASGPDFIPDGRSRSANYDDLAPTILASLGVSVPNDLRGRSLVSMVPRDQ